jgi:hypothetical protein
MPQVSRFYGIIILFFFDDHNPPHFHVRYAEFKCKVNIYDLKIMEGNLPNRAYALVLEGAALHREELMENWNLAGEKKDLKPIAPLP